MCSRTWDEEHKKSVREYRRWRKVERNRLVDQISAFLFANGRCPCMERAGLISELLDQWDKEWVTPCDWPGKRKGRPAPRTPRIGG